MTLSFVLGLGLSHLDWILGSHLTYIEYWFNLRTDFTCNICMRGPGSLQISFQISFPVVVFFKCPCPSWVYSFSTVTAATSRSHFEIEILTWKIQAELFKFRFEKLAHAPSLQCPFNIFLWLKYCKINYSFLYLLVLIKLLVLLLLLFLMMFQAQVFYMGYLNTTRQSHTSYSRTPLEAFIL